MINTRRAVLREKEDNLVTDLEETNLSFGKLGKKYGVTRQAVYDFSKKHGIKRPTKPKEHQTEGCRLCQKLLQISKKPHSEFISSDTIQKQAEFKSRRTFLFHLRILRDTGLVNKNFGRLQSKRAEKAYAVYFTERLPAHEIGRKVGLKNFSAVIRRHREMGWKIPPSLYDGRGRSRIQNKIKQRNGDSSDGMAGGNNG